MTQMDEVYNYLQENYELNEPIFLSEIEVPGIKPVSLRQQLKKLTADGRLKRFDTGIYYISSRSMFRFGSMLSLEDVIRKKYLFDGERPCGYISGMMFANQLGLTTQVPMVYEIYTNKATTDYRDTTLGSIKVIIRRPRIEIDGSNIKELQFLDLIKEVGDISELRGVELTKRLIDYMRTNDLSFESLKKYFTLYPDRIYRNMYEVGLLNGMAT